MENYNYTIEDTQNQKNDMSIYSFAFCGDKEVFGSKIQALAELAEPEPWTSINGPMNDRLLNYILYTFKRVYELDLISISEDGSFCVFNTGLITKNGNDIYGFFTKNQRPNAQPWFFSEFLVDSDRKLTKSKFSQPKIAQYLSSPEETYFDITKKITFNSDHIFDDHWEEDDRFPSELKKLGKNVACSLIRDAFQTTIKKIHRNNRLAVPQFYKGQIMYLLPIRIPIDDNNDYIMALGIEKVSSGDYRANTIFTLEIAYKLARLVMKPESNWLLEK